ncbi:MAG: 5,10-methylenetetrahydrofolate dehydrogenase [Parcubacteria group bacterium]|nr:5,10-methylenetetrahydrofolate dehydrogenase [Parcubacteria group bacterium]
MIVDGKKITKDILKQVRAEVGQLSRTPVVRAIVLAPSAATESYLRIKERRAREAGMHLELVRMENDATTEDLIAKIQLPGADSVIVQLPLPPGIDTKRVLEAIPLEKDADVLSVAAHDLFEKAYPGALLPPVLAAVKQILEHAKVNPNGKKVIVIGNGWLVGAPSAAWFRQVGAEVTVLTLGASDLGLLKNADIIVSGAGSPGLIRPEMLSSGVVLIDAGTSESGGSIVGDADPACAHIASVFTPVPGGVGPVAVACLFRNVAILAQRAGLQTAPKAV